MYNTDTDLLFPIRVIPELLILRGEKWQELIKSLNNAKKSKLDILAFVLFMVRLDGCVTCNADSFRAMKGCTICAVQNIKRYKGDDEALIKLYEKSKTEITEYLKRSDNIYF